MMAEGPVRYAVRVTLHYAVLVMIALICAIPLLWTLSVALGIRGAGASRTQRRFIGGLGIRGVGSLKYLI